MLINFARRHIIIVWQLTFLLAGTSWLWAVHLNHLLSSRSALISHFEAPGQPYSWLFRLGDVIAASLLLLFANFLIRDERNRKSGILLAMVAFGFLLDPLLPSVCESGVATCGSGLRFSWHAAESVFTTAALILLTLHDVLRRKKLVSVGFVALQTAFIIIYLSQLSAQNFNTAVQYVYETASMVWLAWFGRDIVRASNFAVSKSETRLVQNIAATWAFLNGILAILASLAHLQLLGHIHGLYFAGDTAWLAQHGVIIGVAMIYLSRHLYRGELRARQIFLAISGIETVKYAVIAPNAGLMLIYYLTFIALFVLKDNFDRGTIPLTWRMRLRDLYFMVAGLILAGVGAIYALDRDDRISKVAARSVDNFWDYVQQRTADHSYLSSVLLAHTLSVFIFAAATGILWILFKPYKKQVNHLPHDMGRVKSLLGQYSNSSEDFFKLWPKDKLIFWGDRGNGFIAYKISGPIAFALADPIGTQPQVVLNEFIEWCRASRLTVCFLPITRKNLAQYEAVNMRQLQIGSSALIDVHKFLTETVSNKWWRWKRNRAQKDGYEYFVSQPPHTDSFMRELRDVSDMWLDKGGHTERGFALGYFDDEYIQQCTIHQIKDNDGKVVAFTNELPLLKKSDTVTVDLLRYRPEADSAMPYLLAKSIEYISANDSTTRFFDLGFVPFAKVKEPLATISSILNADRFSSKGLEQFKNKFEPHWQDNYLAYNGDLTDLPAIALNIENVMKI